MSTDSNVHAADAVSSVLNDGECQVVVVNTGEGSLMEQLGYLVRRVRLVETCERLYPGGTRNLGIINSSAPIVAFLAADCVVTPGWIGNRVAAHRASCAVASALEPFPSGGWLSRKISSACLIATHRVRLPEIRADKAGLYGLSYDRKIFSEFGLFDESLRTGEDDCFNREIQVCYPPLWDPSIVTLHRYPDSMMGALRDQVSRGRRESAYLILTRGIGAFHSFAMMAKRDLFAVVFDILPNKTTMSRGFVVIAISVILSAVRCVSNLFPRYD